MTWYALDHKPCFSPATPSPIIIVLQSPSFPSVFFISSSVTEVYVLELLCYLLIADFENNTPTC